MNHNITPQPSLINHGFSLEHEFNLFEKTVDLLIKHSQRSSFLTSSGDAFDGKNLCEHFKLLFSHNSIENINNFYTQIENKFATHDYFYMFYSLTILKHAHSNLEDSFRNNWELYPIFEKFDINKSYLIQGIKDLFTFSFKDPAYFLSHDKQLIMLGISLMNETNNATRNDKKTKEFRSIFTKEETLDIYLSLTKHNPGNILKNYRFGFFGNVFETNTFQEIFNHVKESHHFKFEDFLLRNYLGFDAFLLDDDIKRLQTAFLNYSLNIKDENKRILALTELQTLYSTDLEDFLNEHHEPTTSTQEQIQELINISLLNNSELRNQIPFKNFESDFTVRFLDHSGIKEDLHLINAYLKEYALLKKLDQNSFKKNHNRQKI